MRKTLIYLVCFSIVVFSIFMLKPFNSNPKLDSGIDLVVPMTKSKTSKSLKIVIENNGNCLIEDKIVKKDSLEAEIINFIESEGYESLTLKSRKDVEVKHVVFVMEIANRNNIKSTLATREQ